MIYRAKIECSVMAPEYSRSIGPGAYVDLDEPVGGGTLRDYVREEWFEPVTEESRADTVVPVSETEEETQL